MMGAVQLGVLAACVVLFVPMAMAGWHLSRNKMLFFSGALFITLAVCVHLTPYFPLLFVVNNDIINNKNNNHYDYNDLQQSCIGLLHNVQFNIKSVKKNSNLSNEKSTSLKKTGSWGVDDTVDSDNVESNANIDSLSGEKSSSLEKIGSWGWVNSENVISCGFQKLGRPDTSDLLNGSWVVVAGDSQARLFSVSLLGLILKEDEMSSVRGDLFKRHSDYHIEISEIGMKLDFIWAPYVDGINNLVTGFRENGTYPDVFVMGAGLWHMLHMADPSAYGFTLRELKNSLVSFKSPHVFWLGMPALVNSMLNTEEKREKMSDSAVESYKQEIYESELLKKNGGPLLMIDVEMLSQRCGRKCTEDGMHYDGIVYEAAVHILLNALLIESHQKL